MQPLHGPLKALSYALHFDVCKDDNDTRRTSKNTSVSRQQSGNAHSAQSQCVQLTGFNCYSYPSFPISSTRYPSTFCSISKLTVNSLVRCKSPVTRVQMSTESGDRTRVTYHTHAAAWGGNTDSCSGQPIPRVQAVSTLRQICCCNGQCAGSTPDATGHSGQLVQLKRLDWRRPAVLLPGQSDSSCRAPSAVPDKQPHPSYSTGTKVLHRRLCSGTKEASLQGLTPADLQKCWKTFKVTCCAPISPEKGHQLQLQVCPQGRLYCGGGVGQAF